MCGYPDNPGRANAALQENLAACNLAVSYNIN
jgi:hypothetical protein